MDIDWPIKLLYISAFLGVLILAALLLFLLCYFTSESDGDNQQRDSNKEGESEGKLQPGRSAIVDRGPLLAAGKQTMVSTLYRSAKDTDVIIASATSSIPLKSLAGGGKDVIVDISQQMFSERDQQHHLEHECIVCKARKDVTWKQVSCYAQTVIGVLVYKCKPSSPATNLLPELTLGGRRTIEQDRPAILAPPTIEKPQTPSNDTIIPELDSRLTLKSEPSQRRASKGQQSMNKSIKK